MQRGGQAGNKVDERGAAKAYLRRVEGVEEAGSPSVSSFLKLGGESRSCLVVV